MTLIDRRNFLAALCAGAAVSVRPCAAAVKDPVVVKRFASYGVDPLGDGPAAFAATIAADIPVWAQAVGITGVALQ